MDDNTRYAFCIEMAGKSERNGQLKAMDNWYKRAWELLNKGSEYENNADWKTYWNVSDA